MNLFRRLSLICASILMVGAAAAQSTGWMTIDSSQFAPNDELRKWANLENGVRFIATPLPGGAEGFSNTQLVFRNLPEVQAEEILQSQGKMPPSTTSATFEGPYTFQVRLRSGSSGYYKYHNYDAIGDTPEDLIRNLALCPSDVCVTDVSGASGNYYSGIQYVQASAVSGVIRNIPLASVTYSRLKGVGPQANEHWLMYTLRFANSSAFLYAAPARVVCKAGYNLNTSTGICDLSNVGAAGLSSGDGVCMTFAGFPMQEDPDCKAVLSSGNVTTSTTSDGKNVTSARNPGGGVVTQVYDPATGQTQISSSYSTASGDTTRVDTVLDPSGHVVNTSVTNFPKNPPPLYPGDAGTTVPGTTTPVQTAAQCGGPSQPECVMKGVDSLITKVGETNTKLTESNTKLDQLNTRLGQQIDATNGLNNGLNQINAGVSNLNGSVAGLNGTLGGVRTGVEGLGTKLGEIADLLRGKGDGDTPEGEEPAETLPVGLPGEIPGAAPTPAEPLDDELFERLKAPFEGLKEKVSVIPVSSSCPADIFSFTMPLPAAAGGSYRLSDDGVFCGLMADYSGLIRSLSIAMGFVTATFVFLRA